VRRIQTAIRLLGNGYAQSFGPFTVQTQQEHGGRNRHTHGVRRLPLHRYHSAGQESAVAGPPTQDQEAHCCEQKHHAVDVPPSATGKSTVRDNYRELLQHEHLRNGKLIAQLVS